MEIAHYLTADGHDPVQDWMDAVRDMRARVAILRRLERMKVGNFGDHKFCRDGVWELRIDTGPGYRVYYAQAGETLVLLLCGDDKRSQRSDIERAAAYRQDWDRRT